MNNNQAIHVTGQSVSVTFSLPLWVADERFNWYQHQYFDQYHAWAGSYEKTIEHNHIDDALFKYDPYEELCIHPMNCWVKYDLPLHANIQTSIQTKAQEIERILAEWHDWQPKEEREAP